MKVPSLKNGLSAGRSPRPLNVLKAFPGSNKNPTTFAESPSSYLDGKPMTVGAFTG